MLPNVLTFLDQVLFKHAEVFFIDKIFFSNLKANRDKNNV